MYFEPMVGNHMVKELIKGMLSASYSALCQMVWPGGGQNQLPACLEASADPKGMRFGLDGEQRELSYCYRRNQRRGEGRLG